MLKISNISVDLENFRLSGINLEVEKGDYFVIAGPSGSGKTILLETIAGVYEKYTRGKIQLSGKNLRKYSISQRRIGLVFQDNTLFPHLSVEKNITFALHLHAEKSAHAEIFRNLCTELMLDDLLHRNPVTLSGGETQRVLLARTLASIPEIILLDEPLSGVDTHQKDQLKRLLRKLNRKGQTIIHVTHDFEEAYSLANKMAILHKGRLIDTGKPEEILSNPANKFTARFCGYKNFFSVIRHEDRMIQLNREVGLLVEQAMQQTISAVLIKESEINIATEIRAFAGMENILSGELKDYSRSVFGIELVVDAKIELHVTVPADRLSGQILQPGTGLFIQIPPQSIKPVIR